MLHVQRCDRQKQQCEDYQTPVFTVSVCTDVCWSFEREKKKGKRNSDVSKSYRQTSIHSTLIVHVSTSIVACVTHTHLRNHMRFFKFSQEGAAVLKSTLNCNDSNCFENQSIFDEIELFYLTFFSFSLYQLFFVMTALHSVHCKYSILRNTSSPSSIAKTVVLQMKNVIISKRTQYSITR